MSNTLLNNSLSVILAVMQVQANRDLFTLISVNPWSSKKRDVTDGPPTVISVTVVKACMQPLVISYSLQNVDSTEGIPHHYS